MTTRAEHLEWCKKRALEYVDDGNFNEAYSSIVSDLISHPETENHVGITLGMGLMMSGNLNTPEKMRKFIVDFN